MEQPENDPNRGLAEILEALRAPEGPAAKPSGKAPSSTPKTAAAPKTSEAGESPPADYVMRRLETLESELARERERSAEARARLEVREANRGEVEEQIKKISEALKRERESSHASGRIEALEARLDKMHEAFCERLRETTESSRERDAETLALLRAIPERMDALSQCIDRNYSEGAVLAHWVFDIDARLGTFAQGLGALGEGAARAEQNSEALAVELSALTTRIEGWVRESRGSRDEAALALGAFQAALTVLRTARGEPVSPESAAPTASEAGRPSTASGGDISSPEGSVTLPRDSARSAEGSQ